MQAGTLRDRVRIERREEGQDELGGPIESWATVYDAWAAIRHLSGLESIKSDAPTSIVKTSIRIRRRAGIDAGMRVLSGETIYDIEAVLPNADRSFVDLVCTTTGATS